MSTTAGTTASTIASKKASFAADSRTIASETVTATGGPVAVGPSDEPATKRDADGEKGDGDDKNTSSNSVQDEALDTTSEYLAGLKLFSVMSGITVVMMLAMLDMTIISTVRLAIQPDHQEQKETNIPAKFEI